MRSLLLGGLARANATAGAGPADPGYSGCKSRPHARRMVREGTHITAKTHKQMRCMVSTTAPDDLRNRAERLQMLKERRDARG